MTWVLRRLGEIADLSLGKMLDQRKNRGELRPYLANLNIRWGTFELTELRYMRFEPHERERYGLRYGDIIMCEGGEPGRCAVWQEQLSGVMLQKALHRIRPKPGIDNRFLFYCLLHQGCSGALEHLFTGSTIKHLPGEQLSKVELLIPHITVQRRIASILSAYDNLIEVNRRRVAILEEMARRLFEEWFVHLRFPGHAAVPLHDTPDGPLPEGWKRASISELSSYISRGIAPMYDESANTLVVSQKCIRDGRLSLSRARKQSRTPPTPKLLQFGDVLVNSTGVGTLGRIAQAEYVAQGLTVDSHVTIVRPSQGVDKDYFGSAMGRLKSTFERLATGATNQTELNRSALASVEIVTPSPALQALFGQHVRPGKILTHNLAEQSSRLAAARDLLLPRLLSGQLSIAEAPTPERILAAAE